MKSLFSYVCFLLCVVSSFEISESFKILGIFQHQGKSHQDVFDPLLKEIVNKGHELTIFSHFEPPDKLKGWHNVIITNDPNNIPTKEIIDMKFYEKRYFGIHKLNHLFEGLNLLPDFAVLNCERLTSNSKLQEIVRNREKFDLILVEQFNGECALGVAHALGAPVIAVQSHPPMPWTYRRFGQPNFPSYMPVIFLKNSPRMNFVERLENTVFDVVHQAIYTYRSLIPEREIIRKNLNLTVPPLEELAQTVSVVLTNTHFTLHGVKPLVPGIVEVGGIHVTNKMKPLDPELDKYMNSSEHGVIIFSMGSMLKSSTFPVDKREAFVNAFSKVKENVIWKWEGDPIPGLSSNVKVIRWLPQMELLHHPKTVAFISHGGLLGTTEALHAGVPTLYIPVFADQGTNSAAAVEKGIGARVLYTDVTEERISTELAKVLSPEMRQEAKKLSEQWRDRESPLKTAADTVEYVAKYGGKHLRSPAQDLYWFQIYSLDVYLFIFVIILSILVVDYLAIRWLLRIILKKKDEPITKPPFKRKPEQFNNNNNNNEKYKIN